MDLLKRELERKKKAMEQAKIAAAAAAAAVIPLPQQDEDDDNQHGIGNDEQGSSNRSNKRTFLRASELRKFQEEEEEKQRKRRKQDLQPPPDMHPHNRNDLQRQQSGANNDVSNQKQQQQQQVKNIASEDASKDEPKKKQKRNRNDIESFNVASAKESRKWTPSEVSKRLREMGLPIRLFGERTTPIPKEDSDENDGDSIDFDDSQRVERLQQALTARKDAMTGLTELDEFRLGSGHGIRNTFLEKDEDKEASAISRAATAAAAPKCVPDKTSKKGSADDSKGVKNDVDDQQDTSDPHKRIYKYFKGLLKEWEQELAQRPESIARSVAGKNDTKTLKQCKDYIRPLFKLCKNRQLEPGLMSHIVKIVEFCQQGEFVKAHDAYMDVAIGRAAWPIGVTMVGIHARSGRAKIESANVAHVMNSELQRKYLTSVKRLMSYSQKKRDDVDPSKKVLS